MPPVESEALMSAIRHSVHQHLHRHSSLSQPLVYVGFSGGLDSTALLLAAHDVAVADGFSVTALHARHGLQPEDGQWLRQSKAFCDAIGVEFVSGELSVQPGNLEAQARKARYQFFSEQLPEGGLLLLAHHSDDQAETLLLRLFSGRGFLPMRQTGKCGQGWFARPLLGFTKKQLQRFLEGVSDSPHWIDDTSNADIRFDRNYLRHRVLPEISERWPGVIGNLMRVADSSIALGDGLAATLEQLIENRQGELCIDRRFLPNQEAAAFAWLRTLSRLFAGVVCTDRSLRQFWQADSSGQHAVLQIDRDHQIRRHANHCGRHVIGDTTHGKGRINAHFNV